MSVLPSVACAPSAWAVAPLDPSFKAIPKSLWVWRTSLQQLAYVVEVARSLGVKRLLYSVPPDERASITRDAEARLRAELGDLEMIAVAGDNSWVFERSESGSYAVPAAVLQLLKIQANTGVFSGLCLDVEPQVLADWAGNAQQLCGGYLRLLESVKGLASKLSLPLGAAVHPSYANVAMASAGQTSALVAAMGLLDQATLMSYRQDPVAALRLGARATQQIAQSGKPWWFGLTTQNGPNAALISHFGSARSDFENRLEQLDGLLRGDLAGPHYQGLAIHDYVSVKALISSS